MRTLVLTNVNLITKFEIATFTRFRDKIETPKFKSGSRYTDHAPFKVVCRPKANTWYRLPVYKIWQL